MLIYRVSYVTTASMPAFGIDLFDDEKYIRSVLVSVDVKPEYSQELEIACQALNQSSAEREIATPCENT